MKTRIKIVCALLCVLLICGIFASCAGGGTPSDTPAETTPSADTTPSVDTTPLPDGTTPAPDNTTPTPGGEDISTPNGDQAETTPAGDDTTAPDGDDNFVPDWDSMPDFDPTEAHIEQSMSYIDEQATLFTHYNSANAVLLEKYCLISLSVYKLHNEFSYTEKGQLTELRVVLNGEEFVKYEFSYGEDGSVTSAKAYSEGKPDDDTPVIEYHKNGLIKKVGNTEFTHEYDESGRLVFESFSESRCDVTFEYDGDSKQAKRLTALHGGEKYLEILPKYENGTVSGFKQNYLKSMGYIDCTIEYTSDMLIKKVIAEIRSNDGKLEQTTKVNYSYDERQNITKAERVIENPKGAVILNEFFEYSYDAENRMILELYIEYSADGSESYKVETENTYGSDGNISKKTYKQYREGKLTYEDVSNYEYSESGSLVKIFTTKVYGNNGEKTESIEEYYENGKPKKEEYTSYNSQGCMVGYRLNEYSPDGALIKEAYMQSFREEDYNITENEYDAKGNQIKETITYYDKNGTVKYIDSKESAYDSEGKLLSCIDTYYSGEILTERSKKTFDDSGKVIKLEQTYFNADGNASQSSVTEYEYYESGEKKQSSVTVYDPDGSVSSKEISSFNQDGKYITHHKEQYLDGAFFKSTDKIYSYDANGNNVKLEQTVISADGSSEKAVFEYAYDKNNKLFFESSTLYSKDGLPTHFTSAEYNSDGDRIASSYIDFWPNGNPCKEETSKPTASGSQSTYSEMDENGDLLVKVVKDYDKNNNIVLYQSYDSEGNLSEKIIYNSEFDSNGYLKRQTEETYDASGRLRAKKEFINDPVHECITKTTYSLYNENGVLYYTDTEEYSVDGYKIKNEEKDFYLSGTLKELRIEEFDHENNRTILTNIFYDENGEIIYSITQTFDGIL